MGQWYSNAHRTSKQSSHFTRGGRSSILNWNTTGGLLPAPPPHKSSDSTHCSYISLALDTLFCLCPLEIEEGIFKLEAHYRGPIWPHKQEIPACIQSTHYKYISSMSRIVSHALSTRCVPSMCVAQHLAAGFH
jgi:hypothetical protein